MKEQPHQPEGIPSTILAALAAEPAKNMASVRRRPMTSMSQAAAA